jgi:transposase
VRIVDPKRVRSFAQSAGRLTKNDTIDAEMIAWFAETFDEAQRQTYDAKREQLHQMVNARQALKEAQTKLQNQGEHAMPTVVRRVHARVLKTIGAELAKLDAAISAMIDASPHFTELAGIMESVPGIGRTTSAALIAAMPELGQAPTRALRLCWGPPLTMMTAAGGEVSGMSRADVAGPATRFIWPVWERRRGTTPC